MLVFLHHVLFSAHREHNDYTMAAFFYHYFVTMNSDESQLSVLLYYSLLSATTNFPGDSLSRKLISTFKNSEKNGANI